MKAISKLRNLWVLMLLSLLFTIGCSREEVPDSVQEASLKVNTQSKKSTHGKVVHRVVIASKDNCEDESFPQGCKGNLSLVANEYEDGSVDGQWQDTFSDNGEGIHVKVDCVSIKFTHIGPITFASAVIGGYITKGKIDGEDVTGQYAMASAIDLDYLIDDDAPNQEDFVSMSYNGEYQDCNSVNMSMFSMDLFSKGQVKIW